MWKLDYDDKHIDVTWTSPDHPKCRFCGEPIVGWMLKKARVKDIDGYGGNALDIECICEDCRAIYVFGIAIDDKTFDGLPCMEMET